MPEITTPISYSNDQLKVISDKLNDATFDYTMWSNDDLKDLRQYIRNYYRDLSKECFYCRKDVSLRSASNAHIEHLIPKSQNINFIFEPKNLCVICCDCNEIKKNQEVLNQLPNVQKAKNRVYKRYPTSKNSFLIIHPHFDDYDEHIYKCGDFYIDLSVRGSYTIFICQLNRKSHKFGIEPILLSQSNLFDLMNKIMTETNFTKQNMLLNKLREYFISTG